MPIKRLKKLVKGLTKVGVLGLLQSKKGKAAIKKMAGKGLLGTFPKSVSKAVASAPVSVAAEKAVEKAAEETGSRAPKSFEPEEIKVGGASFRKGGLVKDRMGCAMKKPGADAMGRAMKKPMKMMGGAMKNPMKMIGGAMKKPKKMLGGGMTRAYKRGGMAKKGS